MIETKTCAVCHGPEEDHGFLNGYPNKHAFVPTIEPGTPEAAEAIRKAARAAVEALDALAALTAPYRGLPGSPNDPPGMDVEHFNAYHQPSIESAATGAYNASLNAAIHTDLLGEESDGWEWYPAGTTETEDD